MSVRRVTILLSVKIVKVNPRLTKLHRIQILKPFVGHSAVRRQSIGESPITLNSCLWGSPYLRLHLATPIRESCY
jgi:hypothetical protein